MQITLPDETALVVQRKAAAAGFAGRVDAYVAHLIAIDENEDYGAPAEASVAGKNRDVVEALVTAGVESGPATPMTDADWKVLHARIDQLDQANSPK
ncbi:hypothetical protein Pla175_04170 [Pirellulimonas nuda]|uniref:Uncharacterized protein n=1 Tax=Pirellulimonas nuda TaxID=2528009 RepID=A0A518D6E9_9BACT|nr:hypothetical protein [Pirellulimonas nuda]QDU87062.1 hypothetical protein Pla175_04170 [Pirellulimonas nuda]